MVYKDSLDNLIVTEYLNANLDDGIKQKNLDLVLDIIDDYIELREMSFNAN